MSIMKTSSDSLSRIDLETDHAGAYTTGLCPTYRKPWLKQVNMHSLNIHTFLNENTLPCI